MRSMETRRARLEVAAGAAAGGGRQASLLSLLPGASKGLTDMTMISQMGRPTAPLVCFCGVDLFLFGGSLAWKCLGLLRGHHGLCSSLMSLLEGQTEFAKRLARLSSPGRTLFPQVASAAKSRSDA